LGSFTTGVTRPKPSLVATSADGVTVFGTVNIDTGSGNDSLQLGTGNFIAPTSKAAGIVVPPIEVGPVYLVADFVVGGDLNVHSGSGDDTVVERGVYVRGTQNLDVGGGSNTIALEEGGGLTGAIGDGVAVGGDFNIHSGNGIDAIEGYDVRVGGALNVIDDGGSENDVEFTVASIGLDANFNFGAGTNNLSLGGPSAIGQVSGTRVTIGGALDVIFGSGDANLSVDAAQIGLDLNVIHTRGDTNVTITNTRVRHSVNMTTGSGQDNVTIDALHARSLAIYLGSGDDNLTISSSVTTLDTFLDGGPGTDSLTISNSARLARLKYHNFELVTIT